MARNQSRNADSRDVFTKVSRRSQNPKVVKAAKRADNKAVRREAKREYVQLTLF